MSIAGISSTSFSQNIANIQNQQQQIQKQFQSLAQEFQSGNLAAEQTAAQQQSPLAAGTVALPGSYSSSSLTGGSGGVQSNSPAQGHSHHRRLRVDGGPEPDGETANTASLGQLGQPVQAASSTAAQQAYGSVQQDLQQIALNSDLITAQSAALQASSLSVAA